MNGRGLLQSWAGALGGIVSGPNVVCPGPGHSARDRSLSVTPSAAAPNGFLVNSFAGDDPLVCLDYVRARLGLPAFEPQRAAPAAFPKPGHEALTTTGVASQRAPQKDDEAKGKRDFALRIWDQAADPRGTLVKTYLKSRRLELPDGAANEAIRFLASCPFRAERFPAMVCLVRNIETNEPQGVHRTALAPDGAAIKRNGKTFRMSLGLLLGGAIKIDPDEDVTQGICIGEGLETCLAGRQMGLRPVWSAVSTAGIAGFPIHPGLDGLHIFAENDDNGASAKAAAECKARWQNAGRETIVINPVGGNDLNDAQRAAR
jgi:putative DNA primase/helicase